jgi:hypothetical protein
MSASPPSGELRRAQDPDVVRAHERDVANDIASARGPGGRDGRSLVAGPAARGSMLILLGTLVFAVGCLLPFYAFGFTAPDGTMSLWDVSVMVRHSLLAQIGGALALFGGPAVVVGLAMSAIRGGTRGSRPALLAAASV